MKILTILIFAFYSAIMPALSESNAQWRGPARDGHYPATNLLKQWPENGPALQWSFEGIGAGHSSPVVADSRVYVTGIPDTIKGDGRLFVFDLNGKLLWSKDYGSDFVANFPGTRSTPTVSGNLVYIESGNGVLYCLKAENGEEVWKVDFFKDFQADSVQFGFSESVLIDGDRLICTPGGKSNNMVALDRFTGMKIWSSAGFGEQASYSSPALFNHNGNKIIVNLTASSILGIDGNTGELLWRFHQYQDNKIHANTPLYYDGSVVISSASRKDSSGLVQIGLSPDGRSAEIKWRNREIINLMGGNVCKDGNIYMSAHIQPKWYCVDWKSGQIIHMAKEIGGGPVIHADGLFYCYTEKDGEMALVDFTPEKFNVISKFKISLGTGEHWAHPVISDGMLIVRHGNAIMAYKIAA